MLETINLGSLITHQDIDNIIRLKFFFQRTDSLQYGAQQFFSFHLFLRILTIITIATVILQVLLAEVVQQHLTTTNGGLGISGRL